MKRREAKSKGEKERYKHLKAEFQRIARRNKQASLSEQCKEIEEDNRMGKTRDLSVPGGSDDASVYNAADVGSIPGSERFPGEGNGKTLQYSCLENSMGRGPWQATVHGVARAGHK